MQQLTVNREVVASLWVKVKALWNRLNLEDEETEAFKKQITNHSKEAISLVSVKCGFVHMVEIIFFLNCSLVYYCSVVLLYIGFS